MSRLIDADALKSCYTGSNGIDDKASYESIRKMIDAQPIVYNVDEVVQQLEGLRKECEDILQDYCPEYFIDRAIEIVKGGGVNDEC